MIKHIPYNPATDPRQYIAQGFSNFTGGLNQQLDRRRFGEALKGIDPKADLFQTISRILTGGATPQQAMDVGRMRQKEQYYQRQGRSKYQQFRDEFLDAGFDPKTTSQYARDALLISVGKKPRASSVKALGQKPLPEQLSFWQTVYNKTLDPEWGGIRPTTDMDASRELAKGKLDLITRTMRQSIQLETGDMQADLRNAMSAIERGAPPEQVYKRLEEAYPGRGQEVKRALGLE